MVFFLTNLFFKLNKPINLRDAILTFYLFLNIYIRVCSGEITLNLDFFY